MYRLYSFDGVTLPDARSEFEAGTAEAWNGAIALPGGASAFDSLGAAQAPLVAPYQIKYSSMVSNSSLATLETTLEAWRAKVGVRGLLRRRLLSAATYHDITARLLSIDMDVRARATHGKLIPVQWRWLVLDEFWRKSTLQTNSFTLNATPKACAVTNSGNAPVRDLVLTLTPDTSAFTAIEVEVAGLAHWTYTGTLAVGDALYVDCGARRVYNKANSDLYANFELESDHASEDWLPLAANATVTVNVTKTGGSTLSTAKFEWYFKYV